MAGQTSTDPRTADPHRGPVVTDRTVGLRRALGLSALSIAINAVLGGTAVIVGLTTDSLSLLGFGLDAAIDSAASVVLVWRFLTEARQPHRAERIELLAEGLVGVVMLVLAGYLAVSALGALTSGSHPEPNVLRTALLIVAIAILPPLAVAKFRVARSIASRALRADSILTAVAAGLAAIGLISLVLDAVLHVEWADAIGALIIAGVISREGWAAVKAVRAGQDVLEAGVD
jgi:divalent metal cation (Fe/Co/Zn/Cd) transporter